MRDALLIGVPLAGWLAVYVACLSGPRLGHPARPAAAPDLEPGAVPPAVLALLAGRDDLFAVTLADLARRGWFRIEPPGEPGPAMCVLADRAPSGPLTGYEQSAVSHLRLRAGPQGQVPADALTDGFSGGADKFLAAFRGEVVADARSRGLTRPTLSGRRKTLLITLALIPAGLLLLTVGEHVSMLALAWPYFGVLCAVTGGVTSERLTRAGQTLLACAGSLPATPFTSGDEDVAWSGYGDQWRQVTIPPATERIWPGISLGALTLMIVLVVPGIPLLGVLGWQLIPGGHGAELGILTALALGCAVFAKSYARWAHLPWSTEFDGLILRQWEVQGDDTVTHYVAIDDGTRAWALEVPSGLAAALTPGTLVHARVNARLNKQLAVVPLRRLEPTPFTEP
jgi:hypothetical protein